MGLIKGLHHISISTNNSAEFAKTKSFYKDILGLKIYKEWKDGVMIDTGCGIIEIFLNGQRGVETGAIRHIALETDDVDACAKTVKKAGYEVFIEPNDVAIPCMPVLKIRMAFARGPMGEEIEFIQIKK